MSDWQSYYTTIIAWLQSLDLWGLVTGAVSVLAILAVAYAVIRRLLK